MPQPSRLKLSDVSEILCKLPSGESDSEGSLSELEDLEHDSDEDNDKTYVPSEVSSDDDNQPENVANLSSMPVTATASSSTADAAENNQALDPFNSYVGSTVEIGTDAPDCNQTQAVVMTEVTVESFEASAREPSTTSSDSTLQDYNWKQTGYVTKLNQLNQSGKVFRDEKTGKTYGKNRSVGEALTYNEKCHFSAN